MNRLRPALRSDVLHVMTHLRPDDEQEVRYTRGWFDAGRMADIIVSYPGYACVYVAPDGEPVAAAGLREIFWRLSVAWMLATPRFPEIAKTATRLIRDRLDAERASSATLEIQAYSWNGHSDSGPWLALLGFEGGERIDLHGQPFTVYVRPSREELDRRAVA